MCLTGFDYANFDAAFAFADEANAQIKEASKEKTIVLTIIEKIGDDVLNVAKIFHNGEIVHQRAKARLFRFGGEHNHFAQGGDEDVKIVEIDGVKLALLVCFELRFKDLWKKIEGADVVCVPSWWGALRTEHFVALTKTLAIMNQCYVIASDPLNDECSKMSGIITPKGKEYRNIDKPSLSIPYDKKEITLTRRYLDVGIK